MTEFFAHSANTAGTWHTLQNHLSSVAVHVSEFLTSAKYREEGQLAGALHDLGKYGDLFQRRLENPMQISGLDHWSQGAWVAVRDFQALAAAFAVQGHHIGLQSWQILSSSVCNETSFPESLKLSDSDTAQLKARQKGDGVVLEKPTTPLLNHILGAEGRNLGDMLDIRRLFSALVDADFMDTEAHFRGNEQGKVYRQIGPKLQAERALDILLKKIAELSKNSTAPEHVNKVRHDLLEDSLGSAQKAPGLFTLTAPTGSGKTLSMLAFALRHALEHGLRRVVMVIPYLTIIEQTAGIYSELFAADLGEEYVLEHHSMAGLGQETSEQDAENVNESERRRRLLSENWDAPIIVTTSVQLLESLFSNRPSSCRKVHRMAESVILFDEVQTLPVNLVVPTLAALSHLSKEWNSSVVFSTATQPAFEHLDDKVKAYTECGWQPREIVKNPQKMTDRLRRVEYRFPEQGHSVSWDELATELNQVEQALCIVNLKKHARAVYEILEKGDIRNLYHISTNLCPLHRRDALSEVRKKLDQKQSCHLIATQCVEAGVDIDFAHVWRAIGPLDAIIQAAGRCNREGEQAIGRMRVFVPEQDPYPPMAGYDQATKVMEHLLREIGSNVFDPYDAMLIQRYYKTLYQVNDPAGLKKNLRQAVMDFDFPEVAREYRLIEQDTINIVVPWNGALDLYETVHNRANREGLNRTWIRDARPLTVSLYRPKADDAIWDAMMPVQYYRGGKERRSQEDWFVYLRREDYHEKLGLMPPESLHIWIA